MLQNNTINKFQHFPFHLVDPSPKFIQTSPVFSSNIHSSSRINLDSLTPSPTDNLFTTNERLSNLALIKYKKNPFVEKEDLGLSFNAYEENFPWLLDANGKIIDLNKDIRLFDSVHFSIRCSRFLEQRLKMDKNQIFELKLTELLEQFQGKKEITVGELYSHVANLYNKDQDSFKSTVVENFIRPSYTTADVSNNLSEPLGQFGNITLNEIATKLKNLEWSLVWNNSQITFNTIPIAVNLVSYNFMIRSYMKYVHNRPYDLNISSIERLAQTQLRNKNLALFALVGAPLTLILLNHTAVRLKDMGSLNVQIPTENGNSNALFLLISNFYKKIPAWVKLLVNLIIIFLIVLKLLGLALPTSILDVLFNIYYLKIYIYILTSLFTIYQLVNLYLIYKFMNNNIKIPEVLPEFVIKWLKEYEVFRSSNSGIKEYKNMCYTQISIYLVIVLITLFI